MSAPETPKPEWPSTDRPISSRAEDKLGRRSFAEAIAAAIRGWRGRDSLVLALYGAWGTGKSSIKNMVVEVLREGQRPSAEVVDFNPWQVANRTQIGEIFFDEIGIVLGKGDLASREGRRRLLNRWRRYTARLKAGGHLAKDLTQPLPWVLGFSGLSLLLGAIIDLRTFSAAAGLVLVVAAILLCFSSIADQAVCWLEVGVETGRKSLSEVKSELANELRSLSVPVLVVMDDIDRLTPSELQEVFQLVKANCDLPNLVYLLLCEREVTEEHIQAVMKVSGREYLEKVVQVAFDVPAIERRRVHTILFEGLDRLVADETIAKRFDQHRWGNTFVGGLQEYFDTLRDVNRFLSTLSLQVSLLRGQGAFEVNPVDLIALEVLRLFEPKVYQGLPTLKRVLTGLTDLNAGETQEQTRRILSVLVEKAEEPNRERVRETLKLLFPPAEWALVVPGGMHYGPDFSEQWFRELRVCSEDVFDRYFHLAIPQGDLPQAVLERILSRVSDRVALRNELKSLAEQGLLEVSLDRLEAYKQTIDLAHAEPFITALFDIGDGLRQDMAGMFEMSPAQHAERIIYWYLKQEENPVVRGTVLHHAIEATDGLSLPTGVVSLLELMAEGKDREKDEFVPADTLKELKDLCVAKFNAAAANGSLFGHPHVSSVLYRLRDWAGVDAPKAFCEDFVRSPAGALRLLKSFMVRATGHGMSDHVAWSRWFIRTKDLEAFVSPEALEAKLAAIPSDTLSTDERQTLEAFQKAMERRRAGRSDDWP
jgi:predicted KAP-like P-loop ATPase